MTRTNNTYTPWGWTPQDVEELAEGVLRVSTAGARRAEAEPGSGGPPFPRAAPRRDVPRRPSPRRTARSPSPGRCWASATTGTGRFGNQGRRTTSSGTLPRFPIYATIRRGCTTTSSPTATKARLASKPRPSGSTPEEQAEAFAGDAERAGTLREDGGHRVPPGYAPSAASGEGGKAMTTTTTGQAPQPSQHDDQAQD